MPTPIKQFFGTAQVVLNTTVNINAGQFSTTPTVFLNTNDALVPYATHAMAILTVPAWSGTPIWGTVIELWGVTGNTDSGSGLSDTDWPGAGSPGGARYMGSFIVNGVTTLQRRTINVSLRGINYGLYFFLRNLTAVNMVNTAGLTLKIVPFSYGI